MRYLIGVFILLSLTAVLVGGFLVLTINLMQY